MKQNLAGKQNVFHYLFKKKKKKVCLNEKQVMTKMKHFILHKNYQAIVLFLLLFYIFKIKHMCNYFLDKNMLLMITLLQQMLLNNRPYIAKELFFFIYQIYNEDIICALHQWSVLRRLAHSRRSKMWKIKYTQALAVLW